LLIGTKVDIFNHNNFCNGINQVCIMQKNVLLTLVGVLNLHKMSSNIIFTEKRHIASNNPKNPPKVCDSLCVNWSVTLSGLLSFCRFTHFLMSHNIIDSIAVIG
jgi:hypothetical protein